MTMSRNSGRSASRQAPIRAPGVRHDSHDARTNFTNALKGHGVAGEDFRECTNIINTTILGSRASVLKSQIGLTEKDSLRNFLPRSLIAAIFLAESLAADKINYEALFGADSCKEACKIAANAVLGAIQDARDIGISRT